LLSDDGMIVDPTGNANARSGMDYDVVTYTAARSDLNVVRDHTELAQLDVSGHSSRRRY
jgi:hypothetical protein